MTHRETLFVLSTLIAAAAVVVPHPIRAASETSDSDSKRGEAPPLEIATDRPGAGDGSAIVPSAHFQIESGFNAAFTDGATQVQFADTLFRFGISDHVEARLFTSPVGIAASSGGTADVEPLGNLTLGAKVGTATSDDAAVAAIPYVGVGDPLEAARSWEGGARAVVDIGTTRPVGLTFNLGMAAVEKEDGTFGPRGFGSLVTAASLSESIGSYFEIYAVAPPESPVDTFLDAGVTYGVGSRLQLDGYVGLQVASPGSRFVGVGVSYLL